MMIPQENIENVEAADAIFHPSQDDNLTANTNNADLPETPDHYPQTNEESQQAHNQQYEKEPSAAHHTK